MRLSVSMIVKNEESCLATALESVKGADEIIVVDTGSSDKTVEIAKQYTDKVFEDYKWNDNFAEARNHSLDKCSGDWVLIIDADEQLQNTIEEVKAACEKARGNSLYFITRSALDGSVHRSVRAFKRIPEIRWVGAIHNYLVGTIVDEVDLTVVYGYSKAHQLDPDRALRILSKVVREQPSCVREKFYLAREYYYRKDYKLAIYYYDYYLQSAWWAPEMAEAHLVKARCYQFLGMPQEARNSCLQAISINTNFKEAILLLASLSGPINRKRWERFAEGADNSNVLFVREKQKTEKDSNYYDRLFKNHHDLSRYEEIHQEIGRIVGESLVLDIGCGPATLKKHIKNYKGFDFSKEAVKQANSDDVWEGNAYDAKNYVPADYYVATEVFEHLDDFKVLDNIPGGAKIIFSVPSFDDPSHLRTYTEELVRSRYEDRLIIDNITRFNWHKKWTRGPNVDNYILLVQATKK